MATHSRSVSWIWTGTRLTSTRRTAAAGRATPGTATCSPRTGEVPGLVARQTDSTSRSMSTPPTVSARSRTRTRRWRRPSVGTPPTLTPSRSTSPTGSSSPPTSRCCTAASRPTASTSGGWTGSLARTPGSPALTHCGCSTTSNYLDNARDGRRGLTFSRYAGPGSHRYPVGFSGDTVISWATLAFQPHFTATAGNIGYGWWSHDTGGHFFGARRRRAHDLPAPRPHHHPSPRARRRHRADGRPRGPRQRARQPRPPGVLKHRQADGFSSAPSISADGRLIAFVSEADNLVAGDTHAALDVFLRIR